MVNEYQDWEYCSVHMSLQKGGPKTEQKVIEDSEEASSEDIRQINDDSRTENALAEHLISLKNTLSNSESLTQSAVLTNAAVEATSVKADTELEVTHSSSYELGQLVKLSSATPAIADSSVNQQHDQSVDIDVFIPSLLLSFESLLKRVFDDLLNGLKNYDLYSMGLAQYLKLEDEQVNGNVVKLRYRLPIDNVKLVFEAMNH